MVNLDKFFFMKILKDQIGLTHQFEQTPQRIICLVPSITELLHDLELEENIVGITKFCVHPYHYKSTKKIVGGTKKVKAEEIRALKPDIIIANKEENTMEIVEELFGICPIWVTNIATMDDVFKMIEDFGIIFNKRTQAQKWNDKIAFAMKDFVSYMRDIKPQKAAYFIWKNPFMVAGGNTFINEMLRLNHFQNIYENNGRYPEIDLKMIRKEGDPDVVFLSSEPFPFTDEDAFEIGRFTHHAKTVFVDGEMFSWYGSRLVKSFDYFKQIQKRLELLNL